MTVCVLPHDRPRRPEQPMLICGPHRRRLDHLVTDIADDWARLGLIGEAGSAPKTAAPKTRHQRTADPAAPANLDVIVLHDPRTHTQPVMELQADGLPSDPSRPATNVLVVVAGWVMYVADERPLTAELPSTLTGQLGLLARHHDWMSRQPDVDDYWLELRSALRAVRGSLRDWEFRVVGRCFMQPPGQPEPCGGNLLCRNGESTVECHRCHERWVTSYQLAVLGHEIEQRRSA